VASCVVCTVHVETRIVGFLVEPQNQGQWFGNKTTGMVFSCLASKPLVTVSLGLASKLMAQVFRFEPQNQQLQFGDLGLKITATVS
jgi:hypothetical protein